MMPKSRMGRATAALVAILSSSVQIIYAARLNRVSSAFVPSFYAPSQIGYRPASVNEARVESTVCWARRSDKRKRSSGPLGPASPPPEESAAPVVPAEAGGEESAAPISDSADSGSRAGRGTGFGQARAPVTGKDVDDAYERALRKLKNKGLGKGSVSFEGVEPGPGVGQNKTIVSRNIDVFDLIPDNIQLGFERVLIGALSLNLVVLIGLGIGFAFQALPASSIALPDGVRDAALQVKEVVDKYEGYFTPSLGTFFVFSSLLGSFKVAQLGRGGTTYTEYTEDDGRK